MDGMTFELKGGPELLSLLEAMPARMATNVMRGAVLAGVNVMRDRARELCPEASGYTPPGHAPGHLRTCIVTKRGRGDLNTVVAILGITPAGFYGRFVEYGTAASPHSGRHRAHHATKAEPFMRPAADEEAGAAAQAVIDYASGRVVEAAVGAGLVDPLYQLEEAA